MESTTQALMFSDVAGYSKLNEPQLKCFLCNIMPTIAEHIEPVRNKLIELNTWGDAIVAASPDPVVIANLALDLRDLFKNRNWPEDHLPSLGIRFALHAARVFVGDDPIRNKSGILGSQVNMVARIEPVAEANEIWVTEQFKNLMEVVTSPMAFDDLGERLLAKNFGSARLWRLRRHHEDPRRTSQTLAVTNDPDLRPQMWRTRDLVEPQFSIRYEAARTELFLVGFSMNSTLHHFEKQLRSAITNNPHLKIRLLMLHPDSKYAEAHKAPRLFVRQRWIVDVGRTKLRTVSR